jgi:hypothetical protein
MVARNFLALVQQLHIAYLHSQEAHLLTPVLSVLHEFLAFRVQLCVVTLGTAVAAFCGSATPGYYPQRRGRFEQNVGKYQEDALH